MTHDGEKLGHAAEADVSAWAVIRDEPGGRDANKRWIASHPDAPRSEHWLWKSRQLTGDGSEHALTDCAEVIVSRLARRLRLPAADCRYAVFEGEKGVISRNVAPEGFSLNIGASYLPEIPGYVRRPEGSTDGSRVGLMHRDEGYSLDAVQRVLDGVSPPPGCQGMTSFGVFAGYLVLDALVGNSDRHPGNWALLEATTGDRFLAPTYDHGSALGAGLTDTNRLVRDPKVFARKGRANAFTPRKQSLVVLALEAVRREGVTVWLDRATTLDRATIGSILEAPHGRLSEVAATFMERVVLENRRRLCDDDSAEN